MMKGWKILTKGKSSWVYISVFFFAHNGAMKCNSQIPSQHKKHGPHISLQTYQTLHPPKFCSFINHHVFLRLFFFLIFYIYFLSIIARKLYIVNEVFNRFGCLIEINFLKCVLVVRSLNVIMYLVQLII
ncbi:hypothetical protein V8G54_034358 [Vigna mungo]|uniref:Uncharacterized protein n=1 Tax=Vigna mungo TaxID=3915 RepID=A0AAQ3MQI7_VIGMU